MISLFLQCFNAVCCRGRPKPDFSVSAEIETDCLRASKPKLKPKVSVEIRPKLKIAVSDIYRISINADRNVSRQYNAGIKILVRLKCLTNLSNLYLMRISLRPN